MNLAGLGVGPGRESGHLDARLSAYADRDLPAQELLALDRHVTVCIGCRQAAEDERQLLAALRRPVELAPPRSLEASLLSLSRLLEDISPAPTRALRQLPVLPVLPVAAPAMYRSPVRAALVAGLAAGASAAAALSLATGTAGAGSPAPAVTRSVTASGPSSTAASTGSSTGMSAFGFAAIVRLGSGTSGPSASAASAVTWTVQRRSFALRAQSTP